MKKINIDEWREVLRTQCLYKFRSDIIIFRFLDFILLLSV